MLFKATSDNSGYAVRYRSPKPLRASHTPKTIDKMSLRAILSIGGAGKPPARLRG